MQDKQQHSRSSHVDGGTAAVEVSLHLHCSVGVRALASIGMVVTPPLHALTLLCWPPCKV